MSRSTKVGRPTKATPETLAAIVEHVRVGLRLGAAAALEGVAERTVLEWRQTGTSSDEEPFRAFVQEVARAEAAFESSMLASIRTQATQANADAPSNEDWKARAWLLERTRPAEYAPSQTLLVKAQDQAAASVLSAARECLPPEWYAVLLARISGADDGDDAGEDDAAAH